LADSAALPRACRATGPSSPRTPSPVVSVSPLKPAATSTARLSRQAPRHTHNPLPCSSTHALVRHHAKLHRRTRPYRYALPAATPSSDDADADASVDEDIDIDIDIDADEDENEGVDIDMDEGN
ncbi:hypothetical protein EIP86_007552, partial [Pleurotus ostreatoroseus]